LKGTDLEIEITSTAVCEVEEAGTATLPARKLTDIARSLPDGTQALIKVQSERGTVVSGRSRFTLSTLPAADFPTMEVPAPEVMVEVDRDVLQRLLDKTSFAMAQQDVRYYLNGLLLETGDGRLRAVATDGHRLALSDTALAAADGPRNQVIVPRKGVMELQRLLDGDDEVAIAVSDNHIQVTVGGLRFTSKLIDGRFPDYDRVIPSAEGNVLKADRELLRHALQRAAILSNEKYRGVRLEFMSNKVRIQANNPDQEEAEEEVEVDYAGDDMEIGFNVNYLLDALAAVDDAEVELGMVDPGSSCVLRGPGDPDSLYVVMPMRL
jgi:DNA polymerase-3 subunit beta